MNEERNELRTTKLILLGTGTPNAEPARAGPPAAVVVGEQPYVVDFGPGVVRRADEGRSGRVSGGRFILCRICIYNKHSPIGYGI